MEQSQKLPQIQELYDDVKLREKENDLNILLNQPPKQDWVKQHPVHKNVQYIPIERVEYLLTRVFQKWTPEVRETQLLGNSIVVTIRLHYKDPLSGEWNYTDGVGAQPLQTDQGAGATDFNALKSGSVQMAAPAAKSYALKDAAEHLGKLFGRDINRKDQIGYNNLANRFRSELSEKRKEVINVIDQYQGSDKEDIQKECQQAQENGKESVEFYNEILRRMGNVS
ncbi:MAG: hypothetical protein KGY70_16940 [Bacteroidales bacterium]|nr:hypothetical protein [Bacteroidales bacterium]